MKPSDDISAFERLSKDLNEEERVDLLNKIQKKTKDETDPDVLRSNYEIREKEVQNRQFKIAQNMYKNYNIISKIFLWIIAIFSGKKKEELILQNMFDEIKKEIQLRSKNLVDFENHCLTNNLSEEILNFAEACNNALFVIDNFFGDTVYLITFLASLFEKNFTNELKQCLNNLHPESFSIDIENIDKQKYDEEKKSRLKNFFRAISFNTFSHINSIFYSFELIVKLITFDFKSLLYCFSENHLSTSGNGYGTKFSEIDHFLENLYSIINVITFNYDRIVFIEEMIEYSNQFPVKVDDKNICCSDEDIKKIRHIFDALTEFKKKVPLKLLFQYFYRDLLYKPPFFSIQFDFLNMYKEYQKEKVNSEWEEFFKKMKIRNQERLLQNLFKDYQFDTLEYFTLELKTNIDKFSHVKIKNVKKINILANFIEKFYKPHIEHVINKMLIDGNFVRESFRNNLSSAYYTIFKSLEKIKIFDEQFSLDEDVGRKLNSYLKISMGEKDFTQSLQNTVIESNDLSNNVLDEIINALWVINNFINGFLNNTPSEFTVVNFDLIKIPGYITSIQAVTKIGKLLDLFFRIYNFLDDY